MTTILVNAAGIGLMTAIVWWFWLSGSNEPAEHDHSHH